MTLFTTLFPGIEDPKGRLTHLGEILSLGIGGAATSGVAHVVGFTALAVNPLNAFIFCTIAAIAQKTLGDFTLKNFNKIFSPSSNCNKVKVSVMKAGSALSKVVTIASTTFLISSVAPQFALAAMTGSLICVGSLTLNAIFDISFLKLSPYPGLRHAHTEKHAKIISG